MTAYELPKYRCNVRGAGSIVVSDKKYDQGDFEFKIKPSLTNGIVTVFGLADDGDQPRDPFIQLVFDNSTNGNKAFGL